jgi:stage II sporulation protein AA (anti-sigma F factor antagonist)
MLELAHELHDKTLLVAVAGELDMYTAPRLRLLVEGELANSGAQNLLLDLSDLCFLDSSGLGAILGRYREVSAGGGRMGIAGARNAVRRVLRLSGVAQIVSMYTSRDTALRAMTRRRRGRAAARSTRSAGQSEVKPGGR